MRPTCGWWRSTASIVFIFANDRCRRAPPTARRAHRSLLAACRGACAAGHSAPYRRRLLGCLPYRKARRTPRSEEHTSELQSRLHLVCRLLLEKKKNKIIYIEMIEY